MNDQLTDYILKILNKLLCVFRKKYSCQPLLVKMVDERKNALDKRYIDISMVLFLWIYRRRSTRSSTYGLLIAKCQAYGLTMHVCEFLADYLSQRKQRVKLSSARFHGQIPTKGLPWDLSWVPCYLIYSWMIYSYLSKNVAWTLRRWQYHFIFSPVFICGPFY